MGSLQNGIPNKRKASVTREFPPGSARHISQPHCVEPLVPPGDKTNLGLDKKFLKAGVIECGEVSELMNTLKSQQLVKNLVKSELSVGDKANLGTDKNVLNIGVSEYGTVSELVNVSEMQQFVKNLVKSEFTNSLNLLVGKMVTASWMAKGIDFSSILEPKQLKMTSSGSSKDWLGVENQAGAYESKTISEIGSINYGMMPGDIARQCCSPEGPVNNSAKAMLEIDSTTEGKISGNIPTNIPNRSSPETKFPKRRVSVVREYPPFCGRNAPCLTEEERLSIISGYKVRGKEVIGASDRDVFSKMTKLEKIDTPLKKTARDDLKNNSVREGASAATENNLVSHRKPSNPIKGVQNVDIHNKAREKVKETLVLFRAICEEILQREAVKVGKGEKGIRRVDLEAAKMIREKRKEVNTERQWIGSVPGVEVGEEFMYRVELVIVGVHRHHQGGIDYMKHGSVIIATSIIASGGYSDDLAHADVLRYSGQGGNLTGRNNEPPEDQKLEKGNLALKNCISAKTPVRVTRGFKNIDTSNMNPRARMVTYTYDGLYTVEKYWQERGQHGKLVYMFELKRIPGQPRVAWKRSEVKFQKGSYY